MSGTETSLPDTVQAELVVGGMTCGACAARIERRLNRLDGVAATVNYATGRAYFASTGGRDPAELIGVIESAGYTADRARAAAPGRPAARPARPGRWPGGSWSASRWPWRSSCCRWCRPRSSPAGSG